MTADQNERLVVAAERIADALHVDASGEMPNTPYRPAVNVVQALVYVGDSFRSIADGITRFLDEALKDV